MRTRIVNAIITPDGSVPGPRTPAESALELRTGDATASPSTEPPRYIDFATTVDINRSAQDVWTLLADYGRDPEWRAGVLSMSADPPGCAVPGTITAEVMRFAGRTLRNEGKIVCVGPGRQLAWQTTSGIDANGVRIVEARGPHRCSVRLATRVRPHGFDRLLAPLARRLLQRRITYDGRRLRSLAEHAGTAES